MGGKVCRLVIDSRSCENVVSEAEEMFDSGLVFVLLGMESSKGSVVPEAV